MLSLAWPTWAASRSYDSSFQSGISERLFSPSFRGNVVWPEGLYLERGFTVSVNTGLELIWLSVRILPSRD
jgi:hypothetical protein